MCLIIYIMKSTAHSCWPTGGRLVLYEYPSCLDDKYRLGQCLVDWSVFDHLYNKEYSLQLLAYWRKVSMIGVP